MSSPLICNLGVRSFSRLAFEEFLLLNLLLFLLGRLTLRSQGGPQLRLDSISTKSLLVTHRQHVHTGTSAPSDPTQAVAYHAHGDAVIVDLYLRRRRRNGGSGGRVAAAAALNGEETGE